MDRADHPGQRPRRRHFHTAFNVVLALLFFPFLTPYAALLRRLFPSRVEQADPSRPLYLSEGAQEVPAIAIGAAAREALRLADVLGSHAAEHPRRDGQR